jgi:hypothetical protein
MGDFSLKGKENGKQASGLANTPPNYAENGNYSGFLFEFRPCPTGKAVQSGQEPGRKPPLPTHRHTMPATTYASMTMP